MGGRFAGAAVWSGKATLPLAPAAWADVVQVLSLSPQQARIVELILLSRSDKEIGEELGLAVPTVRTYLDRIFRRLGVKDRVGLVVQVFVAARDQAGDQGRRQT